MSSPGAFPALLIPILLVAAYGIYILRATLRIHKERPIGVMILGPITLLDCVVFVIFLIPNLIYLTGLVATLSLVKVLPFLSTYHKLCR